ncbi:MAG: efflux transporter outer membrane subunit [Pirellulales bacterium]|nr:efflux transporter outer membrane subunit [Pirellulales bacterium]
MNSTHAPRGASFRADRVCPRRRRADATLVRRGGRLVLAMLLLGFSGCTSFRDYVSNGLKVGPNYQKPCAPVAQDWIDKDDIRIRDQAEDISTWWTVFGDPVLNRLVAQAYSQNLTLREAGFRVLQVRALRNIAVGEFFPQQQDMFGGYSRNAISKSVANSSFIPDRFYGQWEGGFNLAWELDFWGRYRRAIEAADADLDASVENYDDVLVTLVADMAQNYVQLRVLQQQLALVKANVELQRQTLELAEARFRGGQTSELDVDQARSNLAQTESLVPQIEIQIRQSNNAICVLLGIPPADLAAMLGPAPIPTAPISVAVGIPADLLARRPDIRRAEREVSAQCARVGVAEAELYPHIAVTGTIGVAAENTNNLFGGNSMVGAIGPSFQWNILNYGRLLNNIRYHDARLQSTILLYQSTVLSAGAEVENGLIAFLKSQQEAQALAVSVDAADKAVRIAIVQYKGGIVDFNRVALLEQNLVQQQDSLAQSRGNIAQGLVAVYRALGGGWQIRLAPPGYVVGADGAATPPEGVPAPPQGHEGVPLPAPLPNLPAPTPNAPGVPAPPLPAGAAPAAIQRPAPTVAPTAAYVPLPPPAPLAPVGAGMSGQAPAILPPVAARPLPPSHVW